MCEKEGARAGVVELPAVVTLDGLDAGAELGGHIGEKVRQSGEGVRFQP
jgi:hypothetical protein